MNEMNVLPLDKIINLINNSKDEDFKTSCELSTLNESEDRTTIMVDNTVTLGKNSVVLTYEVDLCEAENSLRCVGVDPNPETVWLHINFDGLLIQHDGFDYDAVEAVELAQLTDVKEMILSSKLNSLTMDDVDHLLKQILITDAVNA